jgi:hypothetical protein
MRDKYAVLHETYNHARAGVLIVERSGLGRAHLPIHSGDACGSRITGMWLWGMGAQLVRCGAAPCEMRNGAAAREMVARMTESCASVAQSGFLVSAVLRFSRKRVSRRPLGQDPSVTIDRAASDAPAFAPPHLAPSL